MPRNSKKYVLTYEMTGGKYQGEYTAAALIQLPEARCDNVRSMRSRLRKQELGGNMNFRNVWDCVIYHRELPGDEKFRGTVDKKEAAPITYVELHKMW